MVKGSIVYSEVPLKTLGKQGVSFEGKKFTRSDLSLDLLVLSHNGVYCAVEVSGAEHSYGHGPDRDHKKSIFLLGMHVPLVTLHLTPTRQAPLAAWHSKIAQALASGLMSSR